MERLFLLWSLEHEAWWKPMELGYTTSIAGAGTFDEYTARDREVRGAVGRSAGTHRGSVAIPLADVDAAVRIVVLKHVTRPTAGA